MADQSAKPVAGIAEPGCPISEQCDLAKVYRALGHPARLAIVEALAARNRACCGEIVDWLPLAQSTVSQHLQVLKETGLLNCETKGRSCHYCLNTEMLAQAAKSSEGFMARVLTGQEMDGQQTLDPQTPAEYESKPSGETAGAQ